MKVCKYCILSPGPKVLSANIVFFRMAQKLLVQIQDFFAWPKTIVQKCNVQHKFVRTGNDLTWKWREPLRGAGEEEGGMEGGEGGREGGGREGQGKEGRRERGGGREGRELGEAGGQRF